MKLSASDIAGTAPNSVYYAYVPSTHTYWGLATFTPSATASQKALVSSQDGGAIGIFTKKPGESWTMITTGSLPFCPSQTPVPPAVSTLWALTDPAACSS